MLRIISYLLQKIASHVFFFIIVIVILAVGNLNIPEKLKSFRETESKIIRVTESLAALPKNLDTVKIRIESAFKVPKTSSDIEKMESLLREKQQALNDEKIQIQIINGQTYSIPGTDAWQQYQIASYKLELLSPFIATLEKSKDKALAAENSMRIYSSTSQSLKSQKATKTGELLKINNFLRAQQRNQEFIAYCRETDIIIEKNLSEIDAINKRRPYLSKIPYTMSNERIAELRSEIARRSEHKKKNHCSEVVSEFDKNNSQRKSLQSEIALIEKRLSALTKPAGFNNESISTDYSKAYVFQGEILNNLKKESRILKDLHESSFIYQAKTAIDKYWKKASAIVFLGLIAPLVSATVSYFGLALLVSNRLGIVVENKLQSGPQIGGGQLTAQSEASIDDQLTLNIRMQEGEVLTVRPEFIGSAPDPFSKSTLWIFNPRRPLMCVTAHLVNMARIRATQRDNVVLRAPEGEHIHLALVTIPAGEALVVRPRGVIGFLERDGVALKVRSVWRLLSLQCWMRLQLRFILIDGPGSIIVRGHNGVRVEEATGGRAIAQSATLAYSAHANYSMTRADTFGGYLSGATPLFKDRFDGDGFYVYEVSPKTTSSRAGPTRFIQDVADAILRAVGI